ncbi:HAD family hydrolase [Actinomadura miaoliensis]|uniref:HAD family hydrolase n=1 Tax=Actinomadura miaoliensis TaxID=430685 RepID=A0ABP7WBM8_9ACTN
MEGPNSVEAVLFDLDGTLMDHEAAASQAVVRSLPGFDPEHLTRRWQELTEITMNRYLAGELGFTEQRRLRITTLAGELGLGAWDADRADAWMTEYQRHYRDAWRAYPDVRPALDELGRRALLLGVITNGDAAQQRAKVQRIGLGSHLPYVVASSEAGAAKPDPAIFRRACAGLGLAPHAVAYVGDRLHTDALAAASAGLHGVWLDRPGGTRVEADGDAGPKAPQVHRITTLADLSDLFSRF